ncbi:MAG: hypothetical protein CMF31_04485 [Kordiimonas sp.]|nr:hypothetical protein [Kordiimonas sp.]|tara:strand:- start:159 stop:644 length:486 start_codon:yes stop_codon:yes gene_type:complete
MTTENISITPLQSHQILQAYPLIQTGDRNCSLAQWKNDAERLIQLPEHRGGILAVQNANSYLHGLTTYELDDTLPQQRLLHIHYFIIVDLLVETMGPRLLRRLENLSESLECQGITINLSNLPNIGLLAGCNTSTSLLTRAGYKPQTIMLTKESSLSQHAG